MRHIVSVLVENEPGVLVRVAGLFAGRGFNIEDLSVAKTLDPTVSRITLVAIGNDQVMEQVVKQLNKLVCVIKVVDFQDTTHIEREMVLIKVAADERTRAEVFNLVNVFRAKVIDVGPRSYVIEVTGDEDKIRAILDLLKPLGMREIVRTGKVAMQRGMQILSTPMSSQTVELGGTSVNERTGRSLPGKQLREKARKEKAA
jgi:acetolactate synthase I/III small subunit